jgi:hypothetical protein
LGRWKDLDMNQATLQALLGALSTGQMSPTTVIWDPR